MVGVLGTLICICMWVMGPLRDTLCIVEYNPQSVHFMTSPLPAPFEVFTL